MDSLHVTAVLNLYLYLFGKGICLKHAKYTWEWQNTEEICRRVVVSFPMKGVFSEQNIFTDYFFSYS